jgi:hypothetical protein
MSHRYSAPSSCVGDRGAVATGEKPAGGADIASTPAYHQFMKWIGDLPFLRRRIPTRVQACRQLVWFVVGWIVMAILFRA